MSKKYKVFLDHIAPGSQIINYAEKATGRPCDICHHEPEKRPAKVGYAFVSEEMRLMRVKLPSGTTDKDISVGKVGFTVTGNLIEWNVCKDTQACRERAKELKAEDGSPLYDDYVLARFS